MPTKFGARPIACWVDGRQDSARAPFRLAALGGWRVAASLPSATGESV